MRQQLNISQITIETWKLLLLQNKTKQKSFRSININIIKSAATYKTNDTKPTNEMLYTFFY